MLDINGCAIKDDKELEEKIRKFTGDFFYCSEMPNIARFLDKALQEKNSKLRIIPEALIPFTFEAQWVLYHNCVSYGCDYEWVYSEDGMRFILLESMQCDQKGVFTDLDEFFYEREVWRREGKC